MYRLIALLALLATPLTAQDKDLLCNTSGDIVQAAVDQRNGGVDEATAVGNVEMALPEDKARFKPAVAPLVQWVYTLEVAQLTEEAAASYVQACLAQ